MTVHLTRVSNRTRRYRKGGRSTIDRAHAAGYVDGHLVTGTEGKGWSCACPDPECEHVEQLAAVLHPNLLAVLDAENIQPPEERKTA